MESRRDRIKPGQALGPTGNITVNSSVMLPVGSDSEVRSSKLGPRGVGVTGSDRGREGSGHATARIP